MKRIEQHPDFVISTKDKRTRNRVASRIAKLTVGLGETKRLSPTVSELKLDFGPGWRVYYTERGDELMILLIAGTKRTQKKDIMEAERRSSEV